MEIVRATIEFDAGEACGASVRKRLVRARRFRECNIGNALTAAATLGETGVIDKAASNESVGDVWCAAVGALT